MGDPRAVGAQIRMKLLGLTPLEAKVAADILARTDIDDWVPLRDVATGLGVSEAMVVKVTKKLGFAGIRDFRQGLVEYCRSDAATLHADIGADDTSGQIVQNVFRTAMQALKEPLLFWTVRRLTVPQTICIAPATWTFTALVDQPRLSAT